MKLKKPKSNKSNIENIIYKDNSLCMLLVLVLVIIIFIFLFRRKNTNHYESFSQKFPIISDQAKNPETMPGFGYVEEESYVQNKNWEHTFEKDEPMDKYNKKSESEDNHCMKLNETLTTFLGDGGEYDTLITQQKKISKTIDENTTAIETYNKTVSNLNLSQIIEETMTTKLNEVITNSNINTIINNKLDELIENITATHTIKIKEFNRKINELGELIKKLGNVDETIIKNLTKSINKIIAINTSL